MIYYIQAVGGGPVKIGHSGDVSARMRRLEDLYKQPLVLLASSPGGRKEERAIHAKFAHLRFGKTEQFQPDPELMDHIRKPLFGSVNPVTPMANQGKTIIATMRGTREFQAYLKYAADKDRASVAVFLDRAVVAYARAIGVTGEIPLR